MGDHTERNRKERPRSRERKRYMFSTPWSQKTFAQRVVFVAAMFGLFLGTAAIVYAISNYITHGSFIVPDKPKHKFEIDLTGQIEGAELGPGEAQTINPAIENIGTDKMYVFIRINCSDDGIFSFTPSSSDWTEVESEVPGEMIYCYGEPTKLTPGEKVTLSGKMRVVATGAMFSEWFDAGTADEKLYFTVTGCAIGTDAENTSAAGLYSEYLSSGGE